MRKKLESDLISLAHSLLQMKNKEDVFALKKKAQEIYEKICLLAFIEEYIDTNPSVKETKNELILKINKGLELKNTSQKSKPVSTPKGDSKTLFLEEELQDTFSVDKMATLFENTFKKPKNNSIEIDLRDRISFIKNLFNGNHEDFNKVLSELNNYDSEEEANSFINKNVKPNYNWSKNRDVESKFMSAVRSKFY